MASDAEIRERGATASVKDIAVGDQIVAAGELKDGVLQAKLVRIGLGQMGPRR